MRVDLHVHLAAAGVHGASLSARFRGTLAFRVLSRALGLPSRDDAALSAAYADGLAAAMAGAREIDRFVVLALDRPYSEVGLPLPADLYVPAEAVLALRERSPRVLLGASVHPYRKDALEALEAAKAQGAVLVKWLPNSQGIDPASALCRPFYRQLAELSLPLLCHTGDEHTIPVRRQDFGDPARLEPALEAGVTVIAAHAGTRGGLAPQIYLRSMAALCGRHGRLFLECAGCATPGRWGALRTLLALPALRDRWVFGSDYPVPVIWPLLWGRSDPDLRRRARASDNALDQRALALLAAGLPAEALERSGRLLGLG
ncbi:MAG: amidohydrolase family protein [Myxococcales bacterium]